LSLGFAGRFTRRIRDQAFSKVEIVVILKTAFKRSLLR
jgi:hypothetical protein